MMVTIPSIGEREDISNLAAHYIFNSAALIYVINWPAEGEPNMEKVSAKCKGNMINMHQICPIGFG